jgi:hypothetical protein
VYLLQVDDTPTVIRELPYRSSHVELSNDAATLVVAGYLDSAQFRNDRSVRAIDTATGAVTRTWPYVWSDDAPLFFELSLARDGLTICHVVMQWNGMQWMSMRTLTTIDGTVLPDYGPPLTFDLNGTQGPHLFSPSGARAAITSAYADIGNAVTMLYQGGVLVNAVDGAALGWLADDRVLVGRYAPTTGQFLGNTIYSPNGTVIATPPLPDLRPREIISARVRGNVSPAGGNDIYARSQNAVYDVTTGALVWQGPLGSVGGAAAGDHVVYSLGTRVVIERFRP